MGQTEPMPIANPPVRRWEWLALGAILLLGLALRVAYLRELAASPAFDRPVVDPAFHDYWARALVSGDWTPPPGQGDPQVPTTPYLRPPGYPHFLALIYALTGPSYLTPRIAQLLLGLANVVLAYALARRSFGLGVGIVAALLVSTYWILIYCEGQFQEPTLLIALLLAALCLLAGCVERAGLGRVFATGVLLGLAALVRPNALLLVPAAALWVWWVVRSSRNGRRAAGAAVALAVGSALAIAPATIRNYRVALDFVLISANSGVNLFIGNNPHARGLYLRHVPGYCYFDNCFDYPALVRTAEEKVGRPLKYSEVSDYFAGEARRFIREQPGAFLKLTLRRAALFWTPAEISHNEVLDCEREFSPTLGHIPGGFREVLALTLLGVLRLVLDARSGQRSGPPAREWSRTTPAAAVLLGGAILVYFLSYLLFFETALYRAPLIPLLLIFAAYGVWRWVQTIRARDGVGAARWAGGAVAFWVLAGYQPVSYQSPGPAMWHCRRGDLYIQAGRPDRAEEEARAALNANPALPDASALLAGVLQAQGRAAEAIAAAREAVRLSPNRMDLHCLLGDVLASAGQRAAAEAEYREALRLDPAYARAGERLKALAGAP